jgi:hypothetical protein
MAVPAYPLAHEEDRGDWPAQGEWTYEEYLRLPDDGNRYEVIRGVLYVTAAPGLAHQFAAGEVTRHFVTFVHDNRLGMVFPAPFDVRLPRGIGTPVQPDLVVFLAGNEPRVGPTMEQVPDLVLEILSPSTRRRTRRRGFLNTGWSIPRAGRSWSIGWRKIGIRNWPAGVSATRSIRHSSQVSG